MRREDPDTELALRYGRQNVDRYVEVFRNRSYFPRYPAEWIIRAHNLFLRRDCPHGTVLDFGCGSGNNARFFLDQGYSVEMLDVTDEAAQLVAQNLGSAAGLRVLDPAWTALPYGEASFDIVLASQVLYYLGSEEKIRAAAAEFVRVLKPGGFVLISMMGTRNDYVARFGRPLGNGLVEVVYDKGYRVSGIHEIVYPVADESGLKRLFDMFEPVTLGHFEQSIGDVRSNFHFIFVGRRA